MSVMYLPEPCVRCITTGTKCVLSNATSHCIGCTKAKKGCSFGASLFSIPFLFILISSPVADKAKERTPAAPKTKVAAPAVPKAKTPIPVIALKAKTPAPTPAPTPVPAPGSITDTLPNTGESDVEIVGESTTDKGAAIIDRTIIVQQLKRPLASRPVPAPKHARLDLEAQLEESQIEAAQLRIWNTELEAEVAKWCGTIVDLRQHSHVQEAKVLQMSNQIYSMGRNWGAWEKEIAEMLAKK